MVPPMKLGEDELVLRPANCPHHALAYASTQHSYRELPIRLNELAAASLFGDDLADGGLGTDIADGGAGTDRCTVEFAFACE